MKNLLFITVFLFIFLFSINTQASKFDKEDFCKLLQENNYKSSRGILQGKRIIIWPAHGYHKNWSSYVYRRPTEHNGIIEDTYTPFPSKYLYQKLVNAWAEVYSVRDLDMNSWTWVTKVAQWKEWARYYLEAIWVPSSVQSTYLEPSDYWKDLRSRPYFSECINGDIFISIHTNGAGWTGTESFYKEKWSKYDIFLADKLRLSVVWIIGNSIMNTGLLYRQDVKDIFLRRFFLVLILSWSSNIRNCFLIIFKFSEKRGFWFFRWKI